MNKCALFIPRDGATATAIQQGYVDALRHLGWKVYVCDPKTKLGCIKLIEEYGVRLIMTSSRFGIRQLPIDVINDNDVRVVIDALPLNPTDITIDGPYDFAHDDEPDIALEINNVVVHTRINEHLWPTYMCGWNSVNLIHLPLAGNMLKALPPTCSTMTDVAMVANFSHRQGILKHLIAPLFNRLDLLGYSYQAFGDDVWRLAGISHNGPLIPGDDKLAHVYATAKVCPNVHTELQVKLQAYLNERSFMIPLCGGMQVTDNPMARDYLGVHCEVASSTTDFMNKVINIVEDQSVISDKIKDAVGHVAHNHTYFNRLVTIFNTIGLSQFAGEAENKGKSAAVRHCWEIDARLSAKERGVSYEQAVVSAT